MNWWLSHRFTGKHLFQITEALLSEIQLNRITQHISSLIDQCHSDTLWQCRTQFFSPHHRTLHIAEYEDIRHVLALRSGVCNIAVETHKVA